MEFEADGAFEKINAKVDRTLARAANVLKELAVQPVSSSCATTTVSVSQVHKVEYKSVPVTAASLGVTSAVSTHPKTTIRTPNDAKRESLFPPALIRSGTAVTTVSSEDAISDALFPPANYFPSKEKDLPSCSIATAPRSILRKQFERAAVEPLVDVKKLKRGGGRHKKPDNEFPLADYHEGAKPPNVAMSPMMTTVPSSTIKTIRMSERPSPLSSRRSTGHSVASTDLTSLICDPMEFTSKDGRMKMVLQPAEYIVKKEITPRYSKVPIEAPSTAMAVPKDAPVELKEKDSSKTLVIPDYKDYQLDLGKFEEDFQLMRKFESSFEFNGMKMDVVGLFNGKQLRRSKIRKIYINGDPFHP